MTATALSWKTLPAPDERADIAFAAQYAAADFIRIQQGFIPQVMEDKWFIYYAEDWLRFHRSWTGSFIYALRFAATDEGARVVESWANRHPDQYRGGKDAYDREVVRQLIDHLLLKIPF